MYMILKAAITNDENRECPANRKCALEKEAALADNLCKRLFSTLAKEAALVDTLCAHEIVILYRITCPFSPESPSFRDDRR